MLAGALALDIICDANTCAPWFPSFCCKAAPMGPRAEAATGGCPIPARRSATAGFRDALRSVPMARLQRAGQVFGGAMVAIVPRGRTTFFATTVLVNVPTAWAWGGATNGSRINTGRTNRRTL